MNSSFIFITSYKGLWSCILLFLFTSCKKFVELPVPENQIQTNEIFKDNNAANSAVAGLYNRMLTSNLYFVNGGITLYTALSSDELYNTSPTNVLDVFYKNSLLSNNSNIQGNLWVPAYKTIYHANTILEGLNNSSSLTESFRDQLQGEALVIRALHYFYLVNLFGDVPFITTTDFQVNSKMGRISTSVIYEQIEKDLLQAITLLDQNYPGNGKGRVNKYAANCLLARIYLNQENWAGAELQSNEVINSGSYNVLPDLNEVFLLGSKETIWQLVHDINNTSEGQAFIPGSSTSRPNYAVTENILNLFEPNDQRKNKWLKVNMVSGQPYTYPFKYKARGSLAKTESYIVFRLAEQYLLRAEARANQNNLEGSLDDLNIIRRRAGLDDTISNMKTEVLSLINKERNVELFCEWGHRWFDLKRLGAIDSVLSSVKFPYWESTDALYPIPFSQIQTNPALTQNAGY